MINFLPSLPFYLFPFLLFDFIDVGEGNGIHEGNSVADSVICLTIFDTTKFLAAGLQPTAALGTTFHHLPPSMGHLKFIEYLDSPPSP